LGFTDQGASVTPGSLPGSAWAALASTIPALNIPNNVAVTLSHEQGSEIDVRVNLTTTSSTQQAIVAGSLGYSVAV
jgi:hypothetical protein